MDNPRMDNNHAGTNRIAMYTLATTAMIGAALALGAIGYQAGLLSTRLVPEQDRSPNLSGMPRTRNETEEQERQGWGGSFTSERRMASPLEQIMSDETGAAARLQGAAIPQGLMNFASVGSLLNGIIPGMSGMPGAGHPQGTNQALEYLPARSNMNGDGRLCDRIAQDATGIMERVTRKRTMVERQMARVMSASGRTLLDATEDMAIAQERRTGSQRFVEGMMRLPAGTASDPTGEQWSSNVRRTGQALGTHRAELDQAVREFHNQLRSSLMPLWQEASSLASEGEGVAQSVLRQVQASCAAGKDEATIVRDAMGALAPYRERLSALMERVAQESETWEHGWQSFSERAQQTTRQFRERMQELEDGDMEEPLPTAAPGRVPETNPWNRAPREATR